MQWELAICMGKYMATKLKDTILKGAIYTSAVITVGLLLLILGFILIKGLPAINIDFLTRMYENKTTYVSVPNNPSPGDNTSEITGYIRSIGITIGINDENQAYVKEVDKNSMINQGVDSIGNPYIIEKGDIVTRIEDINIKNELSGIEGNTEKERETYLNDFIHRVDKKTETFLTIKVTRTGGGIIPMVVTTVYMIVLSLAIAGPIGILGAIYLNEYAKKGRIFRGIHFAIENLAGIPSIIYGLFGSLVFVKLCKMQYSILAGALTVSIILLPIIITTTEETLKSIPNVYRESSLGLGATKLQTITKVILPNAIPGILVAVLLSIGRVVGESAALLLTAGTVARIPKALFGNSASGSTLTIKAYSLMKEENDLTTASAIGIVLIAIIFLLNIVSKFITKRYLSKKGV